MKPTILLMTALIAALCVSPAAAMQHDHAATGAQATGMTAEGGMYIIGDLAVDGVRGMAHLKDVREAMAALGQPATHHFMIAFIDLATGQQLTAGQVALKIEGPDGQVSAPLELIGMQGHFGVDVTLTDPGSYRFQVGTRLADGAKRSFSFDYRLE